MFCCMGTNIGCTTTWKSKNWVKRWILVHVATCKHLPCKLREKLDGGSLLLSQLLAVIGSPAKTIKCLESSFLNAANILQAAFEEVSKKNTVKPPVAVLKKIHHLCNYHFNQTINEAPSDIFVTAFFLVPDTSQKFMSSNF
ncbi:hypothetical protein BDR04DRAFT_1117646 [Suillus decipiens]|nr:hypothetical protein BDR04DRAFT_1117646 [Suillus decipiens]